MGMSSPFKRTTFVIELMDNNIEVQVFLDVDDWRKLRIFDPNGRRILNTNMSRRLRRQSLNEMDWGSVSSYFLEDEADFDEPIEASLARFSEGEYEFEGATVDRLELDGMATLTHGLPALFHRSFI